MERVAFYDPKSIVDAVAAKVKKAKVDYVVFAPAGEPTLDANIEREIAGVKELGVRVEVLTNSSLLWLEDVQESLSEADVVSVKVDAVTPEAWARVNRPHPSLSLEEVIEGLKKFSRRFKGVLQSKTMLVGGLSRVEELEKVASLIAEIGVSKAYIQVPDRPPAEEWVSPPSEDELLQAYSVFSRRLGREKVRLALGIVEPGEASLDAVDPVEDLLSMLTVCPMRRVEVERFLEERGVAMRLIDELVKAGEVVRLNYMGEEFYTRKLPGRESRLGDKTPPGGI